MDERNTNSDNINIKAIMETKRPLHSHCRHLQQLRCPWFRKHILMLLDKYMEKHPLGGDAPEFRVENNILQYKLLSQTQWIDLVDISTVIMSSITATATGMAMKLPSTAEPTFETSVTVTN